MKNISFITILVTLFLSQSLRAAQDAEIERLLQKIDAFIEKEDERIEDKEAKISRLKQKADKAGTPEEKFWINKSLYDEYATYNSDSAFVYAKENLRIAAELERKDWEVEWKIKLSSLLIATGLLETASMTLADVEKDCQTDEQKVDYYLERVRLNMEYIHYIGEQQIGQYGFLDYQTDKDSLMTSFYERSIVYRDSVVQYITPTSPYYLLYKGWKKLDTGNLQEAISDLEHQLAESPLNSQEDAIHAYLLARFYENQKDTLGYLKNLAISAIANLNSLNRYAPETSLEELSGLLFELGDIERAFSYINYSMRCALAFHNRVRQTNIMGLQERIREAYAERMRQYERAQRISFWLVTALAAALLIAVGLIYMQLRKLHARGLQLREANDRLQDNLREISTMHDRVKTANDQLVVLNTQLQDLNTHLKEKNTQLAEANYVKEEYIGYVFSLCSAYIDKMEAYRREVNRKLTVGKLEDLKKQVSSPSLPASELKKFFHSFDEVFLRIYPNFIQDLNALLRPEERIALKENELLNTDLRIYALIRLGIHDTSRIAEFLRCSIQTIYNSRQKMYSRAIVSKKEFAEAIPTLGKASEMPTSPAPHSTKAEDE